MNRILICLLACPLSLWAADIYVDNVKGLDTRDGLSSEIKSETQGPLATVNAAVAKAVAGDTIHMVATGFDYRQEVSIKDKAGEPGKPITIDGHNVTLNGSDPCPKDGWEDAGGGIWKRPNTTSRNILVVDGGIVLERSMTDSLPPGQFCYEFGQFNNPMIYFMPPADRPLRECKVEAVTASGETIPLDPTLWKGDPPQRYDFKGKPRPVRILLEGKEAPLLAAKDHLQPGEWCNSEGNLYFAPPKGKAIADLDLGLAVRQCGVAISTGKDPNVPTAHLVIKNFNVHYVWNDAYNIHGKVADTSFLNCNASDCFDEGFSAHDSCETLLDGATYLRCDNGVMNVNKAGYSITRNLVVRDSRHKGFGVAQWDATAWHELTNATLVNNPQPIGGRYLKIENVLVLETKDGEESPGIDVMAPSTIKKTSILGNNLKVAFALGTGDLQVENSVFTTLENGQGILEVGAKQKVLLNTVALRSNTKVFLSSRNGRTEMPLQEWITSLGESANKVTLLPSGLGEAAAGKSLSGGCDPALWEKIGE